MELNDDDNIKLIHPDIVALSELNKASEIFYYKQVKFVELFLNDIEFDPAYVPLRIQQFIKERDEDNAKEARKAAEREAAIPRCPHCGSERIEKLEAVNRAASALIFGLGSNKIGKTFKCKKCGYTW